MFFVSVVGVVVSGGFMGKWWILQNTHTAVTLHRHDPHAEPNRNDKKITKNETLQRKKRYARKPSVAMRGCFC